MPKVHEGDKVMDPILMPETQSSRERITDPYQKHLNKCPCHKGSSLPRKGQGRAGVGRNITIPRLQPTQQPQPSPSPSPTSSCRPEPPPTAIISLGGRTHPRQSRYKFPVCKDLIFPLSPSKPPYIPTDRITPAYQSPKAEDEPADVDATESDRNIDFEESAPQQEGIIHEIYVTPGKERNHMI